MKGEIGCPNCLANFSTLKKKQEDVEVLYEALLQLLAKPTSRDDALKAIHFVEMEGE